jgi:hypothetical protein
LNGSLVPAKAVSIATNIKTVAGVFMSRLVFQQTELEVAVVKTTKDKPM